MTTEQELSQNGVTVAETRYRPLRQSVFAGAVALQQAEAGNNKLFIRELNRRSYKQAKALDIQPFEEHPIYEHNYDDDFTTSRGELVVAEQWRCVRKIAFGRTSVVYLAFSLDDQRAAAIKVCSFSDADESLSKQATVLFTLRGGTTGIPRVLWFGREKNRRFMVMELLGPSLADLLHYCDGRFSLKTVCMLAVQIFDILEWLHHTGMVHRNIQPQNFCIGCGASCHEVYLVGFGSTIKFRPKIAMKDGEFVPRAMGTRLRGRAIYDSIGSHYGNERSYRDDLESVLYMLIHFLVGDLPWSGEADSATRGPDYFDVVCEKKLSSGYLEGCPPEFASILDHVRGLGYDQEPDYKLLIHLMLSLMKQHQLEFDYKYDWLSAAESDEFKATIERKKEVIANLVDPVTQQFMLLVGMPG